ncbi:MAG: hypothetical protein PHY46_04125, partial [Candidatus Omnitrophica bacterium]|nr:hypothetical protein [Candidatus Omnitrophota bacterium]
GSAKSAKLWHYLGKGASSPLAADRLAFGGKSLVRKEDNRITPISALGVKEGVTSLRGLLREKISHRKSCGSKRPIILTIGGEPDTGKTPFAYFLRENLGIISERKILCFDLDRYPLGLDEWFLDERESRKHRAVKLVILEGLTSDFYRKNEWPQAGPKFGDFADISIRMVKNGFESGLDWQYHKEYVHAEKRYPDVMIIGSLCGAAFSNKVAGLKKLLNSKHSLSSPIENNEVLSHGGVQTYLFGEPEAIDRTAEHKDTPEKAVLTRNFQVQLLDERGMHSFPSIKVSQLLNQVLKDERSLEEIKIGFVVDKKSVLYVTRSHRLLENDLLILLCDIPEAQIPNPMLDITLFGKRKELLSGIEDGVKLGFIHLYDDPAYEYKAIGVTDKVALYR